MRRGELRVLGATIHGFAQACLDLDLMPGLKGKAVAESGAFYRVADISADKWYPFERIREVERLVTRAYENAGPILERVGIEMMTTWYLKGSGKERVARGVDFLRYYCGADGYASVVHGPEELAGSFRLTMLHETAGVALLHSTTPFDKDFERGLIIGGMAAPGDLDLVDVDNYPDAHFFRVEF
jgi:hypothetical protein